MVKLKKLLAAILVAAMTTGLLAGCGSDDSGKSTENSVSQTDSSVQETGQGEEISTESVDVTYPIDSDVTLRIYVKDNLTLSSAYTDFDDVPFIQGLEENTGINIEWESTPSGAESSTSYNLMLQEEDLPDIIMGGVCAPEDIQELLEDGILQDISEYLPVYAPDYWAYINGDDETQIRNKRMVSVDGKVMCFIGARDQVDNNAWSGLVIRQDWLDALGLEIPETLEEFETVARAFHEEYGAVITGRLSLMNNCGFVASAFGAFAGFDMQYYVEDGEVKLANTQEEWKEFLTKVNEWYEEGLIDPNFSVSDKDSVRKMVAEESVGLIVAASGNMPDFWSDAEESGSGAEWVAIPGLAEEKGGVCHFSHAEYSTWAGSVGSYITTACTEEELIAALQFLNYGYTEEGLMYWNFGTEGVSYEYDENGDPHFTELITEDPRGTAQARYDYTGTTDMATASLQMYAAVADAYSETFVQATEAWNSNTDYMDYILPTLVYTTDEDSRYTDLNSTLGTYISEMALKFVVGEESLDNFDGFVDTLYNMGLEELLEIQNNAYQRFMSN